MGGLANGSGEAASYQQLALMASDFMTCLSCVAFNVYKYFSFNGGREAGEEGLNWEAPVLPGPDHQYLATS